MECNELSSPATLSSKQTDLDAEYGQGIPKSTVVKN